MPPQPPFHDEHVASKTAASEAVPAGRGSCMEVFLAFLRLGLTAFGGPVAHLAYFREEFVDRRRWLDDYAFPIWWRFASSCRGRPAARSAWPWA